MTTAKTTEPLGATERRLVAREWQLVREVENLTAQLRFLEAAGNAPPNGAYKGDSAYLRSLWADAEHANAKREAVNAEIEAVKGRRDEMAAELERVRADLSEVRRAIGRVTGTPAAAGAIDRETAAEIADARRLQAEVERAALSTKWAQGRLNLLREARRSVAGEFVKVDSPVIDRLLFGAFDADERIARIDAEVEAVTRKLAEFERQEAADRRSAAEASARLATKIRRELQVRGRQVDKLMTEAEAVSAGMEALQRAAAGVVDLEPELAAPAYFRSDRWSVSAFRAERGGRVTAGVLEAAS